MIISGIGRQHPCGIIEFTKIPDRISLLNPDHIEFFEFIGHGMPQKIVTAGYINSFYDEFYKQLPGFNPIITRDSLSDYLKYRTLQNLGDVDKEYFYKHKPEIIHMDPIRLYIQYKAFSKNDVEEVATNVAPFFDNNANLHGTESLKGTRGWDVISGQKYYSFYEHLRILGEVYKQQEKVEKVLAFTADLEKKITDKIHSTDYRPKVAIIRWKGNEVARCEMNDGIDHWQYRMLEVIDAFATSEAQALIKPKNKDSSILVGKFDIEGLLAINPDVIIMPYIIYTFDERNKHHTMRKPWQELNSLKEDPIGMRINAVKNNRIYPGGTLVQGPIFYIFQLEMAAKQCYPELFGEYKQDNSYTEEEKLFSREELAKIVNM